MDDAVVPFIGSGMIRTKLVCRPKWNAKRKHVRIEE